MLSRERARASARARSKSRVRKCQGRGENRGMYVKMYGIRGTPGSLPLAKPLGLLLSCVYADALRGGVR